MIPRERFDFVGITLGELAGEAGVSLSTISRAKRGDNLSQESESAITKVLDKHNEFNQAM